MMIRRFVLRILLWFLILLVILEIIAFFFMNGIVLEPQSITKNKMMPFHHQTLWTLSPNTAFEEKGIVYDINEYGLRTTLPSVKKESILFVGDSSTFGIGVDSKDSLSEQVTRCSAYKSINAGISGYSTLQIANRLPSLLVTFQPKWVVLVVPWSDLMHTGITDKQRFEYAQKVHLIHEALRSPLMQKSNIIRWFVHTAQKKINENPIQIDSETILQPQSSERQRRVPAKEHLENIKSIHQSTRQAGVKLLLVQLPINRKHPHPPINVINSYRDPVSLWSNAQQISVIDGDILIRSVPRQDRVEWFVDHVHPNGEGHNILAKDICTFLVSSLTDKPKQ